MPSPQARLATARASSSAARAELEQLRRAFLAVVAVVECEGGDRQLLAVGELLDQRLLQGTDDQFDAIGLGLAVEVI